MSLRTKNGNKTVFYRKLFASVLPIAFQQFMLAAVSASDALMLGVVNQDALSAVSLAGQITFVFNLFMGGLTMGTSILAAQYYGKGDRKSIEKILLMLQKSLPHSCRIFSFLFMYPRAFNENIYQGTTVDFRRHRISAYCIGFLFIHWSLTDLFVPFEKYKLCSQKYGNRFQCCRI